MSDVQTSMFEPAAKPNAEKVRALRAEAHRRHLVADERLRKTGDLEAFLDRRLDAEKLNREATALEST